LISNYCHVVNIVFFFWRVIPGCLNFMCLHFGTHCFIFIGLVSKKNDWDEIARVFIWVKVWLKSTLGQSEGGGMGPFLPYMLVILQASTWEACSMTACSSTWTCLHPPSDWSRLLLSQTFTSINTLAISSQLFFLSHDL